MHEAHESHTAMVERRRTLLAAQEKARAAWDEAEVVLSAAERARSSAEAMARSGDWFLAAVVHELRAPLNSIALWVQAMQSEVSGAISSPASSFGEAILAMNEAIAQQERLLDDLTDTAALAMGRLRLHPHPVDLCEAVRQAARLMEKAAQGRSVPLEVHLSEEVGRVRADPQRITQIVVNLLANALRYTHPPDGRIVLSLRRVDPNEVELTVVDTGEGMTVEQLGHVFDRVGPERPHPGGLGLGLVLARQLAQAHGGTLAASSDGKGKGTCFTCTLPLSQV